MTNIKILVAVHKESMLPQNDIFLPIQVGRKNATIKLDMQGDDEGDNISDKNPQFCELTAIYWAWKNLHESDYVGLFHYRRYLTVSKVNFLKTGQRILKYHFLKYFGNIFFWGKTYIQWPSLEMSFGIDAQNDSQNFSHFIQTQASKFDIVTLREIKLSNQNIKTFWSITISSTVIDNLEIIIQKEYPNYFDTYKSILHENKTFPCNMFVMRKEVFDVYANFIFTVLFKLESHLLNLEITPLPRTMGYIGELLTSTFIYHKIKLGSKIKKTNVLLLK